MKPEAPTDKLRQLVVFVLQDQRYALPLPAVERIVHAVEVTPLPGAPVIMHGIIDLAGQVIPVLNLRGRLGLPEREIQPGDQFVIIHTTRRTLALVADEALGLLALPATAIVPGDRIFPGLERIQGVVRLEDGLVLINDLEKFLTLEESRTLDQALKEEVSVDG